MHTKQQMNAAMIKNGRLAKNYTQQDLAQLTGVSLRSIQRIENAEVMPRAYTLNVIAKVLDVQLVTEQEEALLPALPVVDTVAAPGQKKPVNKLILSVGIFLIGLFFSAAFLVQSPGFPETTFELFVFWGMFCLVYMLVLMIIWRDKNQMIPAARKCCRY